MLCSLLGKGTCREPESSPGRKWKWLSKPGLWGGPRPPHREGLGCLCGVRGCHRLCLLRAQSRGLGYSCTREAGFTAVMGVGTGARCHCLCLLFVFDTRLDFLILFSLSFFPQRLIQNRGSMRNLRQSSKHVQNGQKLEW